MNDEQHQRERGREGRRATFSSSSRRLEASLSSAACDSSVVLPPFPRQRTWTNRRSGACTHRGYGQLVGRLESTKRNDDVAAMTSITSILFDPTPPTIRGTRARNVKRHMISATTTDHDATPFATPGAKEEQRGRRRSSSKKEKEKERERGEEGEGGGGEGGGELVACGSEWKRSRRGEESAYSPVARIKREKKRKEKRKKRTVTPVSPPWLAGERLWRWPGSYCWCWWCWCCCRCCCPLLPLVRGKRLSRSIPIAQDRSVAARPPSRTKMPKTGVSQVDERGRWLNRDRASFPNLSRRVYARAWKRIVRKRETGIKAGCFEGYGKDKDGERK